MEKFFKLKERNTTVKTEVMAGITTFLTMAYILAVNPGILSEAGMDFSKVFAATAIAASLATLVMALLANLPFALAPGMGLNAFLTYTVVLGMGYTWQFALTAVFVEGIIFLILTAANIREAIVNSIPANLKRAIGVGIGLFIAFIGMQNAGIIVGGATLVSLNPDWFSGASGLAMVGLVITGILLAHKVNGALLIGIIVTTIIGIPFGITKYAGGSFLPPAPYFFPFEFSNILSIDFVVVVFTFLFVDMFDTVGTLIGCATKADMIQEDGSIPNCKEALFADAIGTTAGAILGTSTVTTFVESSSGVVEGGRTGLTALTVSVLFALSLFLAPLFGSIPSAATAPALIIVGVMMMSPVKDIEWDDMTEAIPAFLTMIFMIVAYSIADGIMFGILSFVLLKLFTKKTKDISKMTWVVFALFVIKIIFGAL
ncbi:NCS2 family permease [Sphaerochaeta halotolerans]|jgi:AGZA family xanthine/uracil permease-like MFS transporter|uniref:NCS2 family permease n=1 Tax=Sphaerochaeta halotolerans TaxID=2293840 RepID=A0A372MJC8_9SPIR|nr:NCS2 family permease [Sphaerochaeta halotolerans]MBG0766672.1 NCS2 family permease [Spirochaetaceae bacterium]MDK2860343.1 adenine/guanine/hypoxanthine permease [Sphaerochaeta sp.]MDN5332875.1 adenine/guanine/hypoxanthine permease [Sphaerochaeta sp.]MXI85629.1 NCS2 family permease [Sphaerochaeta halotolerans]RFU95416.1 NCS2 family permease [Sphaerochaeta halotolerans]